MKSRANRRADLYPLKRLVKSVQHYDVSVAASGTSVTATLPFAVDTTKSVISYGGFHSAFTTSAFRANCVRHDLTNANTVTVQRNTSASHTVTSRGCVIEFYPWAVKSIQTGTITIAAASASNTATINAVDTTRSVVFYLGLSTDSTSTSANNIFCGLDLTNSNTVTATRGSTANSPTVGYAVVEFNPGVVKSIQQKSFTSTSSSTSETQSITAVDRNNTVLLHNGSYSSTSIESTWFYDVQMTSSTVVTLARSGTSTTSRTVNYTALELNPGFIRSMQRGISQIASSAATATATLNPVVTSLTGIFWAAMNPNTSSANGIYATAKLTNGTTVTVDRNSAVTGAADVAWEAVEFL